VERPHIHTQRHVVAQHLLQLVHQAHRVDGDTVQGGRLCGELPPLASDLAEQLRIRRGCGLFYLGGEHTERGRDIAGQFQLRPIVLVDVRSNGIDMDKMTLASLVPEAWFVFDRVVPHGDDHISRV
jgi:hypothetical protein